MPDKYKVRKSERPIQKALALWPVIIVALGGAVAWGEINTTTDVQGAQISENKNHILKLLQGQATIEERTKRTAADVKDIKTLLIESLRSKAKN